MGNLEYHRAWKKEYRKTKIGKAGQLLGSAKSRAKAKKLEISITKEWILKKLEFGVCELSGLPFDFSPTGKTNRNPFSPSIDRIDSNKGYIQDNCRLIILSMNDALNQYGLEHFLKVATAVIDKQKEN